MRVTKIDDIDVNKLLVSKEKPYVQKIHLNNLFDTMIMMLLDHYVWSFHKWLVMLENLKVIQKCPLRLAVNNYLKNIKKYGKKLKFIKHKIWHRTCLWW